MKRRFAILIGWIMELNGVIMVGSDFGVEGEMWKCDLGLLLIITSLYGSVKIS